MQTSVPSPDQKSLDYKGDAVFLNNDSVDQFIHLELIFDVGLISVAFSSPVPEVPLQEFLGGRANFTNSGC